MTMDKNWLLFIPSLVFTLFLWNFFAFLKVLCECPWNEWGFMIATVTALLILSIQGISLSTLIKKQSKRIYIYYGAWVFLSLVVYIIITSISLSILS